MNECFVAYFDILGYGNRIKGKGITEEYNIHKKFVNEGELFTQKFNKETSSEKILYIHFSDTHIFYTADSSEISFGSIVGRSLWFMTTSTVRSPPYFPMRGSLCYGNFMADKENNIVVGEALREAHCLEKAQDWSGCCLSHKCIEKAKEFGGFNQFKENGILVEYPAPLKKRKNYLSYVINMESFIRIYGGEESKKMPITEPEFWRNIFMNKGLTNSNLIKLGKPEELKLENTSKFFSYIGKIKNQWKDTKPNREFFE